MISGMSVCACTAGHELGMPSAFDPIIGESLYASC
jgi:hypothetical protein